ncbi:MAG: DAK2 domain-containing protein [Oscillospiraceae bacterium]|nr:DAK2 domain-containing protein [Oscillospiraceae bacterium]
MSLTIDGGIFRRMILSAAASLQMQKQHINELNVFPVPDGDTGTNMCMTLGAAVRLLQQPKQMDVGRVAGGAASALLRDARGNSGVILSLLFRGMSKSLKGAETCTGAEFAAALAEGVEAAYKAVMKPAEGTILTVSRLAAAAAGEKAEVCDEPEAVLEAAVEAAKAALAETVNQNPVLKKAGVVDAGGKGWLLILEGMLAALRGQDIEMPTEEQAGDVKDAADFSDFATEDITFTYCTEFIVSRQSEKDPEMLRSFLSGLGDSLVLVDDEEIIKVHVHTNQPGIALQEALEYGYLVKVKIENMRLQHTEKLLEKQEMAEQQQAEPVAAPEKPFGVVSVCAGDGLAAVFRDLGCDQIVSGGQTMNPSTQNILSAINRTPAETVFVFPNNKNIIMAAEQTIPLTEKTVIVIPSKTVPQGVTALLSFDPDGTAEANTEAMTEALGTVETMQITYAARDSDFDGYEIHQGDYLALCGGALFGTAQELTALLQRLAGHVAEDGREFVTLYTGADTTPEVGQQALEIFQAACPDAEVTLVEGGQPVYYFLISAE